MGKIVKKKHNPSPIQYGVFKNPLIQKNIELETKLNVANKAISDQLIEKKKREEELAKAQKELVYQEGEKAKRAQELEIAKTELAYQNSEKADRASELAVANQELKFQQKEKEDRADELGIANKELAYQSSEKADRASELVTANQELIYQKGEKAKRAQELKIANKELAYQSSEKADRASELIIATKELLYQSNEKKNRADELGVAQIELAHQTSEKADRVFELAFANQELAHQRNEKRRREKELDKANLELAYQKEEKKQREAELILANKELAFQSSEKADRASELITANKELIYQKGEKAKRAQELVIANQELAYQTSEKANRAFELDIANKELIFQKSEKADRASELDTANKELIYQIGEKEKRAAEFVIVNEAMINQNQVIENLTYHDQLTGLYNRKYFIEAIKYYDLPSKLPISVIMGDINGLALINDSLGYTTVEEIVMKVTALLRKVVRKSDVIIRLNNGEFALILPKTSYEKAETMVSALKANAEKEKAGSFDISISCGVQSKTTQETDINQTIKEAFESLNKNKKIESQAVENNTIGLIMKMLFEKNNREMLHSSRVSELCKNVAMKMHFEQSVVDRIRTTGMLHDIGKIGIDEKILNKPGKLDEREWEEIKKHCEIGHRILSASNEFVTHAEDVLKHHERMDGKGYPKGIHGADISLVAKIISISDTYDALTSDRTYRSALSEEDALQEIIRCSGVQFDPQIVVVFVDMIREKHNL